MKKPPLIMRFIKNIALFGSLFIILSIVVDWFRKPTPPLQFAEQVFYDIRQQPKVIAQLSHERPMLLYFWGTWCSFCRFTSPSIQQFSDQGIPVLSVALKSGSVKEVADYLNQNGYSFSVINDPEGDLSKAWDIQATPTILFIKNGKVINHTTGLTSSMGLKVRMALADVAR